MASKHIAASRSLLLSSSSSSELIEHSTTTFQKYPLYVLEEQRGYRTALEYIQLRVLRDKFTNFMFPPFLVSIAGFLMKPESAHLGLYKARFNSDVAVLSTGGPGNSQGISAVRFVPGSQLSLLWRTPWTYATFGRAYGSAAESRRREIRVSDEVDDDNDGDAGEPSELEDDDGAEDEQCIEDSDDEYDDEEQEEEDQEAQSQEPAKKKIQTKPPKSKFPDQQGRALNEKITARILRLVNDDGRGHRIVSRDQALTLAKGKNMDLVLVDGRADPPVCKIYDFNKEEYRQEQILKDRKKKKGAMARLSEVKELRFNSKTEPKDLKMKVEQAKEFMNRGYRVKFVAIFKGKSDDEKKRLEDEKMIDAVYPMLEDVATIEQGPRVESRQAWVMLRHLKFASKKKARKREAQLGATDQVDGVKHEDQVYSEPDFYQEQEENVMHAPNASSVSEVVSMGRLQGYPSTLAAPPTELFAFRSPYEAGHSRVQPQPLQEDTVERFGSELHSPTLHGFPHHTQSLQGIGGSQGSERPVSPPPGPLPSMPTLQRAGVQCTKIQISPPGVSPLPASSLQGFEGSQLQKLQGFEGSQLQKLQASPSDGMFPLPSEQRPSHSPKIQMFSMPSQSPEILSQKQSTNDVPHPEKAIGSEVTKGVYPGTSRGRGISPPNQQPHSLFSSTPPTSLRGPPSNLQGSLLNLYQSPSTPVTHMRGPSNLRGPLPDVSPSTSVPSSHQGVSSNLESPLTDLFSSPPPATLQRASPSLQGSRLNPLPFIPAHNVQERYSSPFPGSEGVSQGVPKYPPPPLQGFEGFAPRGVPRHPPPPVGQPRYPPPLGQPSFVDSKIPQGEFPPDNQNRQLQRQMQGPDGFMPQMRSQALDFAAPDISQRQNYRPEQGQDRHAPPPLPSLGSAQHPQQGPSNLFGSPQRPQHGSPQPPQQGPPNLFGSPQLPQHGSPQRPHQGPPNLFGSPQRPQHGSPQRPHQGPPNLFGSPLRPQQGPSNLFGSPAHPQQGSPPHPPPEPSQIQFGYQPVGVPQGPRQGGPWSSQQAPSRYPSPIPSHPQQTGQPPSQGHHGYLAQQEPQGGGQNNWQSQASQGYPPQQNQAFQGYPPQQNQVPQGYPPQQSQAFQGYPPQQNQVPQGYPPQQNQVPQGYPPQQSQAPQGYPPQRGFQQTRLAQGAFGFQENYPQHQASQGSPPARGLLQMRPVVPSPPGFRPSWSTPPQSQEYSPLFGSPSDKS